MSQTTTESFRFAFIPAVNLHNHSLHLQSARIIVMKSIHEAYKKGNSRLRFMTGRDEDGHVYKAFPKWMSDIAVRHIVKDWVKHDGSYVVFLKISEESENRFLTSTSFDTNVIRLGAIEDDIDAQFILGLMYLDGYEVEKQDNVEALYWLKKSANQGDINAQLIVAKLLHEERSAENDEESLKYLAQSACYDNPEAQFILGQRYLEGDGVTKDIEQAIKWLKMSAKQGHSDAQLAIGNLYYDGKIVQQNIKAAIKMFIKAAKQNNVRAQIIIGEMYSKGEKVEQNDKKALQYFRSAANQDNSDAQFILGRIYAKGKGVKQDFHEALKWFKKAAELGHYEAGIISKALS